MLRRPRTGGTPARALAAALAALAVAPASAEAAARGMTMAAFDVTVSGAQTSRWTLDSTRHDGCVDGLVRTTGAGTHRFTFRSVRRTRLDALRIDRGIVVSVGTAGLPVRGTVELRGRTEVAQLSGGESWCGGTEQPRQPPAPDCGARRWRGTIQPVVLGPREYPAASGRGVPRTHVLALTGPVVAGDGSFEGLYRNCHGSRGLLDATPNSAFPLRRVFSRARRIVVRGSDTVTEEHDGHRMTTTLRWRAVLSRRGGHREPPRPVRRPRAPACANGRDDDGDGFVDVPRDRGCRSPQDPSER